MSGPPSQRAFTRSWSLNAGRCGASVKTSASAPAPAPMPLFRVERFLSTGRAMTDDDRNRSSEGRKDTLRLSASFSTSDAFFFFFFPAGAAAAVLYADAAGCATSTGAEAPPT